MGQARKDLGHVALWASGLRRCNRGLLSSPEAFRVEHFVDRCLSLLDKLVFVRMNDDRIARRMLVETAVRLALAAPAMDQLDAGLGVLASMLGVGEENFDSTE